MTRNPTVVVHRVILRDTSAACRRNPNRRRVTLIRWSPNQVASSISENVSKSEVEVMLHAPEVERGPKLVSVEIVDVDSASRRPIETHVCVVQILFGRLRHFWMLRLQTANHGSQSAE